MKRMTTRAVHPGNLGSGTGAARPLDGVGIPPLHSSATEGYPSVEESLAFSARNVCAIRSNPLRMGWPLPGAEGTARTYSVEGFTLVHASGKCSGGPVTFHRELRDVREISQDGVDR